MLNVVVGSILGSLSGLGLEFLIGYLSQGFTTPEQVQERMRLPVLVAISDNK